MKNYTHTHLLGCPGHGNNVIRQLLYNQKTTKVDGTTTDVQVLELYKRSKTDNGGEFFCFTAEECTLSDFNTLMASLHPEARHSLDVPNAGGSSGLSEALSMQYMHRRHGARSFVAEMEVPYWIEYKICDYLMLVDEKELYVGVSVTRAVPYPFGTLYTIERARELLKRKLYGLIVAQECVREDYGFHECILHVWCATREAADRINQAHMEIAASGTEESATYDKVHVICTVCPHKYLYTNRPEHASDQISSLITTKQ